MIHTFKHGGTGFVLDVETGSVHALDDEAFEAVARLEKIENDGGDVKPAKKMGFLGVVLGFPGFVEGAFVELRPPTAPLNSPNIFRLKMRGRRN